MIEIGRAKKDQEIDIYMGRISFLDNIYYSFIISINIIFGEFRMKCPCWIKKAYGCYYFEQKGAKACSVCFHNKNQSLDKFKGEEIGKG